MSYLLITGATGLLGRYLLRDALLEGRHVVVIVRANRVQTSWQRIERIMVHWEQSLKRSMRRPVVLEGDLTQPQLGLATDQHQWLARNCRSVLHSAASLVFYKDDATGEPYRNNVDGTSELINFCNSAGVNDFHLVSTAYVCGQQSGRVLESEADPATSFGNDYERSKSQAERLVRTTLNAKSTIFRPSIIVGDSQTGFTSTFRGFYTPLQLSQLLADDPRAPNPAAFLHALGLNWNDRKNIVPVDWIAAATTAIMKQADKHGPVYHLTNPQPVTIGTIHDAIIAAVGGNTSSKPQRDEIDRIATDDRIGPAMDTYRAYLRDDPEFDSTNTERAIPELPCPMITCEVLAHLARYAIDVNFAAPQPDVGLPPFEIPEAHRELKHSSHELLGLELTGASGGSFVYDKQNDLVYRPESVSTEPMARLYGSTATMAALVDYQLTLESALCSGLLVVELSTGDEEAKHDVEQAIESLRKYRVARTQAA